MFMIIHSNGFIAAENIETREELATQFTEEMKDRDCPPSDLRVVEYKEIYARLTFVFDDEGWIDWDGGNWNKRGILVDVILRDGDKINRVSDIDLEWSHGEIQDGCEIVKYRICQK